MQLRGTDAFSHYLLVFYPSDNMRPTLAIFRLSQTEICTSKSLFSV